MKTVSGYGEIPGRVMQVVILGNSNPGEGTFFIIFITTLSLDLAIRLGYHFFLKPDWVRDSFTELRGRARTQSPVFRRFVVESGIEPYEKEGPKSRWPVPRPDGIVSLRRIPPEVIDALVVVEGRFQHVLFFYMRDGKRNERMAAVLEEAVKRELASIPARDHLTPYSYL
jgi:hypothetical protein